MPSDEAAPGKSLLTLDVAFLESVGLKSLVPAEADLMLVQVYETLESRVGMRIAQSMTDAQLDEFEVLIDADDEAGALRWLETNYPDYRSTVREELDSLTLELRQLAPTILALTGAF